MISCRELSPHDTNTLNRTMVCKYYTEDLCLFPVNGQIAGNPCNNNQTKKSALLTYIQLFHMYHNNHASAERVQAHVWVDSE